MAHRAIERLVLWALVERQRSLSSLDRGDLVSFREFLYSPPANWCRSDCVMRCSEDWRPLRGPLKAAGVRQVLVYVNLMFAAWHASGYLRINPAHGLSHVRDVTPDRPGSSRRAVIGQRKATGESCAFGRGDLDAMACELAKHPDSPARRRLRAILSLFLDSGLRASEVQMLTLNWPVQSPLDNVLSEWVPVALIGGERKPRAIQIRQCTLNALEVHYQDRMAQIDSSALPAAYGNIPRELTPALSILRPARRAVGKPGPGQTPADAPRRENIDGRLSSSSVAGELKAFFRKVSQHPDLGVAQADFAAASTHWLRTSFAHHAAEETHSNHVHVQKLRTSHRLGSAEIYLDTGIAEKVRAFQHPPLSQHRSWPFV